MDWNEVKPKAKKQKKAKQEESQGFYGASTGN